MILPPPSKIVCVGRNYAAHAKELGNDVPERPLIFLKPPSSLLRPGGTIVLPAESSRVEHEAEIAVFIGRRGRNVSESEALELVAGYAPLNDVTARDLQKQDVQFTRGKGFDTFCPVGEPVIHADWQELEIIGRVNGEVRQHGRATDMLFGVPTVLAWITRVMTLMPGDIVATGTPEGVGPLTDGDIVEIEVPGIGTITNSVSAERHG